MTTTVVGVDGSPDSDLAVEWAAVDADRRHRPLHVVHAYLVAAQLAAAPAGGYEALLRAAAEGTLDAAVTRARAVAPQLDVTTELSKGQATAVLLEAAEDAALLVVGNRGLGGFAGLLVGSVGAQLAAYAPVPVVIVRRPTRVAGPEAGRIVVAVDIGHDPDRATAFAFEQASCCGAGVTVMQADPRPAAADPRELLPAVDEDDGDLHEHSRRMLSESVAGWAGKYPDVDVRTVFVHTHSGAGAVAAAAGAALLVVGCRGRGAMTGLRPGSVSQAAVHHAASSVAIVR